jgi:hypothetical protein
MPLTGGMNGGPAGTGSLADTGAEYASMNEIISKLGNATKAQTAIAAALAAFVFGASFDGWYTVKTTTGGVWMIHRVTSDVYFCRALEGCRRVKSVTP